MIFSNSAKSAMLNSLAARLDSGNAAISIRQGVTELVLLPLSSPAHSAIAVNKLTFAAIEQQLVMLSGTPDKAVVTLNGVIQFELAIGVDLMLSKPTLQAGGYFKINDLTITL